MGPDLDRCLQAALARGKDHSGENKDWRKAGFHLGGGLSGGRGYSWPSRQCQGLIVGAGDMAELIASDMIKAGLGELTVIHPEKRARLDDGQGPGLPCRGLFPACGP